MKRKVYVAGGKVVEVQLTERLDQPKTKATAPKRQNSGTRIEREKQR